jgi:hypothetical protein
MLVQRFVTEEVEKIMETRYAKVKLSSLAYSTLRVLHATTGTNVTLLLAQLIELARSNEIPDEVADECWEAMIASVI